MEHISKHKTGLTFGFLISSFHLVWGMLVALGIAQMLLNFILNLHMISMAVTVTPFDVSKAVGLIVVTFIVGYIFGWLMAFFWNKCFEEKN
jgi:thiamine transporter ThiT